MNRKLTFLNFLKGTNGTMSLWADLPPDLNLKIIRHYKIIIAIHD